MARTNELEQQIASIEAMLNKVDNRGGGKGSVWVTFPITENPCPPLVLVKGWLAECGITPTEIMLLAGSVGKRLALVLDMDNPEAEFPDGWGWLTGQGRLGAMDGWTHPRLLTLYRSWLSARGQ